MGFLGGSDVNASAWNAGDPGSIPGSGRSPGEGKWQPTTVLLPGESNGGRSLVGYSPWGRKESDMTERLHSLTHSLTSWEIDGETVETVSDFVFGGSKITADDDCSHEINRCLFLEEKQ